MDIAIIDNIPYELIDENDIDVFIKGPAGAMMGIPKDDSVVIMRDVGRVVIDHTIHTASDNMIMGAKILGG